MQKWQWWTQLEEYCTNLFDVNKAKIKVWMQKRSCRSKNLIQQGDKQMTLDTIKQSSFIAPGRKRIPLTKGDYQKTVLTWREIHFRRQISFVYISKKISRTHFESWVMEQMSSRVDSYATEKRERTKGEKKVTCEQVICTERGEKEGKRFREVQQRARHEKSFS